jgi:uncharacterized protein (DUF305 family)
MYTDRSIIRRLSLIAVAGAGAVLLLTSCGGDDSTAGHESMTTSAPAVATASAQPSAQFNDADVEFAQMMIPHHEQAVGMAALADTRASDKAVKTLATKIKAAQEPEIKIMQGWLSAWGKSAHSGGMGHDMPGIMSERDMKDLEAAKGRDFDKRFGEMMIAHHNGAIEMARTEQQQGAAPEAKELAKVIETTQQAEVAQLREIVGSL